MVWYMCICPTFYSASCRLRVRQYLWNFSSPDAHDGLRHSSAVAYLSFRRPQSLAAPSLKGWPGLSLNGKEMELWPKKGPGSLENLEQETFRKSTRWIQRISQESAANLHAQIPMPTFSWQLLQCNHWTAQKLNQCQSVQLDHAAQNDQKWRLTRNVQKTEDVMHLKFVANH